MITQSTTTEPTLEDLAIQAATFLESFAGLESDRIRGQQIAFALRSRVSASVADEVVLKKRARQIIDVVFESPVTVEIRAFSQPEEMDRLEDRIVALLRITAPTSTVVPVEQSRHRRDCGIPDCFVCYGGKR